MRLVGRVYEKEILKDLLDSEEAEFLAVYGRRRIGKTYLIREYFEDNKECIFFNVTGSKNASLFLQIEHFTSEISRIFYNSAKLQPGKNWDGTFKLLTDALNVLPKTSKIILFFDEFPWLATKNSNLLTTLDYYWNQHWSRDRRIKLIICGSSASWIVNKIINNKGGLHNRITKRICLLPFNLEETKEFLKSKNINLTHPQIVQLYMVTGGVPYYLTHIKKGLSAAQNIDVLAFKKDGLLTTEFDNLFASLFENYEIWISLIRFIAQYKYGIGQEEILKKIWGTAKGGLGLKKLQELELAGFIKRFKPYLSQKKGLYYKVIDEYTLFYLDWVEPVREELVHSDLSQGYWERQQNSPKWYAWAGCSFEAICYKHINKIQKALNIGVTVFASTWKFSPKKKNENGAQIDLLFDRIDDSITLCEIKFTQKPFTIDKSYAQDLENKIQVFKTRTKTQKQIFLAMIISSGLKRSPYSDLLISGVVTLEDFFQ